MTTDIFAGNMAAFTSSATVPLQTQATQGKITARKPLRDEWFRVSTRPQHKPMTLRLYTPSYERRMYLVANAVAADPGISGVAQPKVVYVAVSYHGALFLSLVGVGLDQWSTTSRMAHQQAHREWTRMIPRTGEYAILNSPELRDEPQFPDTPYNELLRAAFEGNVISDLSHPAVRAVHGLPPLHADPAAPLA